MGANGGESGYLYDSVGEMKNYRRGSLKFSTKIKRLD